MVRHRIKIEPKFHQIDRLIGAGRLSRLFFSNINTGTGVLMGLAIKCVSVLVEGRMGAEGQPYEMQFLQLRLG
jgi:hypothetical protein